MSSNARGGPLTSKKPNRIGGQCDLCGRRVRSMSAHRDGARCKVERACRPLVERGYEHVEGDLAVECALLGVVEYGPVLAYDGTRTTGAWAPGWVVLLESAYPSDRFLDVAEVLLRPEHEVTREAIVSIAELGTQAAVRRFLKEALR